MLFLLALAQPAPVQVAPQQGPMKTFGDWAVACDNVKRCEMTSLLPEDGDIDPEASQIGLTREPGPEGGWTVDIIAGPQVTGRQLYVEGAGPASAAARWTGGGFDGGDALSIVEAIANGKAAVISDGEGKEVGRVSLAGTSAALRFIDAEQGRAGTVTAAVAKGAKPARAVPVARPLPVVPQSRPSGTAAAVPPAILAGLWKQSGCGESYEGAVRRPEIERHELGGGATLVLIPCGSGAYNFSTIPYVLTGGKATLARFDAPPGWEASDAPTLVNAGFDAKAGLLGSYAKGRGIGDCGSMERYVWDGAMFRLVEGRVMGECRGSANWLPIWRARAVPR